MNAPQNVGPNENYLLTFVPSSLLCTTGRQSQLRTKDLDRRWSNESRESKVQSLEKHLTKEDDESSLSLSNTYPRQFLIHFMCIFGGRGERNRNKEEEKLEPKYIIATISLALVS